MLPSCFSVHVVRILRVRHLRLHHGLPPDGGAGHSRVLADGGCAPFGGRQRYQHPAQGRLAPPAADTTGTQLCPVGLTRPPVSGQTRRPLATPPDGPRPYRMPQMAAGVRLDRPTVGLTTILHTGIMVHVWLSYWVVRNLSAMRATVLRSRPRAYGADFGWYCQPQCCSWLGWDEAGGIVMITCLGTG